MEPHNAMTPDEEYEFYARDENRQPQGPAVRRRTRLSEMVPVRFSPEMLEQVRARAQSDDRSVAAWVRRVVEHELRRAV